eukprot:CCRYP_014588-RA/>CCRYP_014588-RA protein AED:0.25 eAED:0.25 QI:0/0/0/1/1/1/2/0/264
MLSAKILFNSIISTKGARFMMMQHLIAQQLLKTRLNKHGYHQHKLVPGLWAHDTLPIQFTLVVDDFGIKYVGNERALHLKSMIEGHYQLSTDWSGADTLESPLTGTTSTTKCTYPCPQCTPQASTTPPLDKHNKKFVQHVSGKFLLLGQAINPTLLCPISAIASQSATPTQATLMPTKQLLKYLALQEDTILTYHASNMILAAHSNVSYLSEPKAHSHAGSHFPLSSNADIMSNNGAVLNIAHIIKHIMASATEAELTALYHCM